MRAYRLVISFIAASIVVLAMLVLGLTIFDGRETAATPVSPSFSVEYAGPGQAAQMPGQDSQTRSDPAIAVQPDPNAAEPNRR